jgi:hypothetical protein
MADIVFYASPQSEYPINNVSNSGLAFMGGSWGASVAVGEYQQTTWISNGAGTVQGSQCNNIKYLDAASGIVNSATSGIPLTHIPNQDSTLRINFNHGSAVKLQNTVIRAYDRTSINNNPSGVTVQISESIHPNPVQGAGGSGDTSWTSIYGSGVTLSLTDSPGLSGLSPNGAETTDTNHDFYVNLSLSPDSIGSKSQVALYASLEYL